MQTKAESTTRIRYQRSSTGTIAFGECDANGKFVTIENQHAYKVGTSERRGTVEATLIQEESLGGWCIRRTVDNHPPLEYIFPEGAILHAGRTATVFSSEAAHEQGK